MDYDIQAKTAMVVHNLTGMYHTLTPYTIFLGVFDLSFSLAKIFMKLYLKFSSSDWLDLNPHQRKPSSSDSLKMA